MKTCFALAKQPIPTLFALAKQPIPTFFALAKQPIPTFFALAKLYGAKDRVQIFGRDSCLSNALRAT
jgi:hypothetical protein